MGGRSSHRAGSGEGPVVVGRRQLKALLGEVEQLAGVALGDAGGPARGELLAPPLLFLGLPASGGYASLHLGLDMGLGHAGVSPRWRSWGDRRPPTRSPP